AIKPGSIVESTDTFAGEKYWDVDLKSWVRSSVSQELVGESTRLPKSHVMQGIGEFILDDCNGDLRAMPVASASMTPTQLEPIKDIQVKNMMLVEQSGPGEHPLSVGTDVRNAPILLLDLTPGTFRLLAPHQDVQFTRES